MRKSRQSTSQSTREKLRQLVEEAWSGTTPGMVVKLDRPGRRRELDYFPATDTAVAVITSLRLAIPRLLDGPQSPLATAADL
ncbi:MAG: hypothetical protein VKO00_11690 [Cyanobacteriota bacterium]|nr:hypothetical protein [Cyanobacteriota bacterium]